MEKEAWAYFTYCRYLHLAIIWSEKHEIDTDYSYIFQTLIQHKVSMWTKKALPTMLKFTSSNRHLWEILGLYDNLKNYVIVRNTISNYQVFSYQLMAFQKKVVTEEC